MRELSVRTAAFLQIIPVSLSALNANTATSK